MELQGEVEEHTVADDENHHNKIVEPGMGLHFAGLEIVQNCLGIRPKEPNHLLQVAILVCHQQFIRVFEGGKIVQPYPVFWNAASAQT